MALIQNQHKKSVLLHEIFFPTKYAQWRMVEIKSFIEHYDCDIIVNKIFNNWNSIGIDYEDVIDYYSLNKYNILIFDKRYNYLNKYNKTLDGTKFNITNSEFCYVFTRKTEFDINSYDFIYHIFYSLFQSFNNKIKFDSKKQAIRLYPGGGNNSYNMKYTFTNDVKIISTQPFITNNLKRQGYTNYIEILYAPLLLKDHIILKKKYNNDEKLNIIFTTSGGYSRDVYAQKGYFKFLDIVRHTKQNNINNYRFYCCGDIQSIYKDNNLDIIYTGRISQNDLNDLFYTTIDITINLHDGGMDGWPQGIEALICGVVSIMTDINNYNEATNMNFVHKEDIFILQKNYSLNDICEYLNILYSDRQKLLNMSHSCQTKMCEVLKYENQQQKVFDFLNL